MRDMKKAADSSKENRILEKTLESLDVRREAPISVFILLFLLYFAAAFTVGVSSGSDKDIIINGVSVPVYVFAGVFSALSNLCIIFMVIFCGKPGFITSVIVIIIQIPMIMAGIVARGNYTSIPGIFTDILTISAVIVILIAITYRDTSGDGPFQRKRRKK